MTQTHARVRLFLALVDTAAHLGDQIARKNPILGAQIGIFQPNASNIEMFIAYYKNYCIDHNQTFHSDRDVQVLTVGGPNMPKSNPRWRMAAILKNRKILISSQPIDRFWWNFACWWFACWCVSTLYITPQLPIKFGDFENPWWQWRPSWKFENRNMSATKRAILTTFSTMMSLGLPDAVCQWNLTNLRIQDGDGRHSEKSQYLCFG